MDERLGQELVEAGLITSEVLASATEYQKEIGGSLERILVKLRHISDADMLAFIAKRESLDSVSLADVGIDEEMLNKLPRELLEKHLIVPISHTSSHLNVGLPDVSNFPAIEEVRFLTGLEVNARLVSNKDAANTLSRFYGNAEEPTKKRTKKHNAHDIARTVGGLDAQASPASIKFVAELEASPAKLIKALAALFIERKLISGDELKDMLKRLG